MATCPAGLRTMSKIAEAGAGIGRVTSMRSARKTVSGTWFAPRCDGLAVIGCGPQSRSIARTGPPRQIPDATKVPLGAHLTGPFAG